jgi:4-hydroxy-3-methylbut-2-enyl diphosphate reductase
MKIADRYGSPDERYSYKSALVERLRTSRAPLVCGRLTIQLAEKLGFCWGVDRAVAMVWDAIRKNPGRRLWLLNQIIHNPKVNEDFRQNGVRFVFGRYAEPGGFDRVKREDLVIIPAFSAEVEHLRRMQQIGCEVVDTTCPWVEKPHRRVLKYIEDGFTTLIHGQPGHDETRATCSLVDSKGGRWIVLRGLEDADFLCAFLRGEKSPEAARARFVETSSRGFDPSRDLEKVGMVNQTTMLASESRHIAELVAAAIRARDAGREPAVISCAVDASAVKLPVLASAASPTAAARFRDFDTICPATQDNQDAVIELTAASPPDLFLVLGGYDSSNTANLLRAATGRRGAYHLQDPASIGADAIRHRDPASGREIETRGWLPDGPLVVALSAGASTPDTELAEVIRRLCVAAGAPLPEESAAPSGAAR